MCVGTRLSEGALPGVGQHAELQGRGAPTIGVVPSTARRLSSLTLAEPLRMRDTVLGDTPRLTRDQFERDVGVREGGIV